MDSYTIQAGQQFLDQEQGGISKDDDQALEKLKGISHRDPNLDDLALPSFIEPTKEPIKSVKRNKAKKRNQEDKRMELFSPKKLNKIEKIWSRTFSEIPNTFSQGIPNSQSKISTILHERYLSFQGDNKKSQDRSPIQFPQTFCNIIQKYHPIFGKLCFVMYYLLSLLLPLEISFDVFQSEKYTFKWLIFPLILIDLLGFKSSYSVQTYDTQKNFLIKLCSFNIILPLAILTLVIIALVTSSYSVNIVLIVLVIHQLNDKLYLIWPLEYNRRLMTPQILIGASILYINLSACLWNCIALKSIQQAVDMLEDQNSFNSKLNLYIISMAQTISMISFNNPMFELKRVQEITLWNFQQILNLAYVLIVIYQFSIFLTIQNQSQTKQLKEQSLIYRYMQNQQVDLTTQKLVQQSLRDRQRLISNIYDVSQVVTRLPEKLRRQILPLSFIHLRCLTWGFVNHEVALHLSTLVREEIYCPDDVVFEKDSNSNMSIKVLQEGLVQLYDNDIVMRTIDKKFDSFGELGVFTGFQRVCSARVLKYTRISSLSRDDILLLLDKHQECKEKFFFIGQELKRGRYTSIGLRCLACNRRGHIFKNCPLINYKPNKRWLIKKFNESIFQERKQFKRQPTLRRQYSAYASSNQTKISIKFPQDSSSSDSSSNDGNPIADSYKSMFKQSFDEELRFGHIKDYILNQNKLLYNKSSDFIEDVDSFKDMLRVEQASPGIFKSESPDHMGSKFPSIEFNTESKQYKTTQYQLSMIPVVVADSQFNGESSYDFVSTKTKFYPADSISRTDAIQRSNEFIELNDLAIDQTIEIDRMKEYKFFYPNGNVSYVIQIFNMNQYQKSQT